MGTSNFGRCNTTTIFAFMPNREAECINECEGTCDCADLNFEHEWIAAKEILYERFEKIGRTCNEWTGNDRSKFANVSESTTIAGIPVELIFECEYESGYYEGAMFDYSATVYFGQYSYDFDFNGKEHIELMDEDVRYTAQDYDINRGLLKIHVNNAVAKWIERTSKKMIEQIEEIYSDVATNKLRVVGRFSNGETIYENIG